MNDFGLYIHWPYCLSKCPYCDFASCRIPNSADHLRAGYLRDIQNAPDGFIRTIYFGGGTPSLMPESFFADLMGAIYQKWSVDPKAEITLEANPDAITLEKMRFFRQQGVNRLSIGVQSLSDKNLKFLGRRHDVKTALKRLDEALSVFPKVNMDLMYGLPHQSCRQWALELNQALSLGLKHYSLYQLTIEDKTAFAVRGIQTCSDMQARRLYTLTDEMMNQAGCPAYEVSNYATPGQESRHNMRYWTGKDYIGIGPAAHGRILGQATYNQPTVGAWLKTPTQVETLTPNEQKLERLLMGLRLRQKYYPIKGISLPAIQRARQRGWLDQSGPGIRPTLQGTLMLNQLILMLSE